MIGTTSPQFNIAGVDEKTALEVLATMFADTSSESRPDSQDGSENDAGNPPESRPPSANGSNGSESEKGHAERGDDTKSRGHKRKLENESSGSEEDNANGASAETHGNFSLQKKRQFGRPRCQWRKYGEKTLKRPSLHDDQYSIQRCYYRCNYPDCPAKKRVEKKLNADKRCVGKQTYIEGEHTHDVSWKPSSAADEEVTRVDAAQARERPNLPVPSQMEAWMAMASGCMAGMPQTTAQSMSVGGYGSTRNYASPDPFTQMAMMQPVQHQMGAQMGANQMAMMQWVGMQAGMQIGLNMIQQAALQRQRAV